MARMSARRFTVYDVMEAKGVFEKNPANIDARDEQGLSTYKKAEFPRMLYHPEGKIKITRPAEAVMTPFGPKMVGEQTEIINKIVQSAEEEALALKEGWHRLPAMAIRKAYELRGEEPPAIPIDSVDAMRMAAEDEKVSLRKQIEALQAQNAELTGDLALKSAKTVK